MPKKTKNRSSKEARNIRQARARQARQEQHIDALIEATQQWFPVAVESGAFTILTDDGPAVTVTLDEMRLRVNADLAAEGEPPLAGQDELKRMLEDDVSEGHILCLPNGLWRFPQAYLPTGGQS